MADPMAPVRERGEWLYTGQRAGEDGRLAHGWQKVQYDADDPSSAQLLHGTVRLPSRLARERVGDVFALSTEYSPRTGALSVLPNREAKRRFLGRWHDTALVEALRIMAAADRATAVAKAMGRVPGFSEFFERHASPLRSVYAAAKDEDKAAVLAVIVRQITLSR